MASTLQLKKRLKSVGNISKITKAMEMVSAAKMRQAQHQALTSRHYSSVLDEILRKIATVIDTTYHPLLTSTSPQAPQALVIISTDKGLTGSLNTNLFRFISNFQLTHKAQVFTMGRLAKEFAIKAGFNLVAEFGAIKENISYESTQPIAKLLIDRFKQGVYSKVYVSYMDFVSTLSQQPNISLLLPITKEFDPEPTQLITQTMAKDYVFEPDPHSILDWLLPYSVEMKLYQSMLEARASEHSARMVAMKNASDNANEIASSLTLSYNRTRQANITNELSDIVTATLSIAN